MKLTFNKSLLFCVTLTLFFLLPESCADPDSRGNETKKKSYPDRVVIHKPADAKGLHPYNDSDGNSTDIRRYLFQKLLTIDNETVELTPWMAASLPEVEMSEDANSMVITYELKEGMVWDNGDPIVPRDVEFSFMCAKNPKVDAPHLRDYLDFIVDFKYDANNPRKFQFVCNKVYMLWDHVSGNDVNIISEKFYDPDGILKDRRLKDFAHEDLDFIESSENMEFARNFNDVKYNREKDFIYGSGPYSFVEWKTNQRTILKRKDDWWGDKHANEMFLFDPGPETVIFETITDMTTAITAMKSGKLDVLPGVRTNDWLELPKSRKFNENYVGHQLDQLVYTYLGMYRKNPLWRGKKTRKALAHLVDVDLIIENLLSGIGRRIVGPIHPSLTKDYNDNIEPYKYDFEKAKALLKEDGWEDSDQDGVLDKIIDGKRTPFKLDFVITQNSDFSKNFALIVKESVKTAGIEMTISSVERSVYLERKRAHKLDLWLGAWGLDARPPDPIQLWHSKAVNGGSNDSGFGDASSDALIERIRKELDPEARTKLYHEWQELLHEDVPYVFLFSASRKLVMHKRFKNPNFGVRSPGFWGGGLQVK